MEPMERIRERMKEASKYAWWHEDVTYLLSLLPTYDEWWEIREALNNDPWVDDRLLVDAAMERLRVVVEPDAGVPPQRAG